MPSPDLYRYIDLPLYDLDPQDVYESAVNMLRTQMPDLVLREGMIESVLLESWANMVAELIFAVNRLPSAIFESYLQMHGVVRDFGEPPEVLLRFEANNSNGVEIPAGTAAVYEPASGEEPIVFRTDMELRIPVGSRVGTVLATGDRFTSDANGALPNTELFSPDSLAAINYIKFHETPYGGRPPESEEDYFSRGVNRFARLNATLVSPDNFIAYAMEEIDVERSTAIDNYNSDADPDNNGPVGNDLGHITVAVYGNEEEVTDERKEEIRIAMEASAYANLTVHVTDPTITPVNVSVRVRADEGYDTSTIITNVTRVVDEVVNPMMWDWKNTVYRNELISQITDAEGVDFVLDMMEPATNITLPGVANLVRTGTVNVEVVYE